MFSNILPFICSNTVEFTDERNCLREITFPKLRNELEKLSINFDPFDIDWTENDDYVKSGTRQKPSLLKKACYFTFL